MINLPNRIKSIDVYRGITMFLLIGEFTLLFEELGTTPEGTFMHAIANQLHHHPWNGLHFWDLIQPFFMFIVGLSLPFAIKSRIKNGVTVKQLNKHVLKRSIILFLLGWGLYCIGNERITFYFQNVLAQIGITYLIAYAIMKRSYTFQIICSIALLIIADSIYRFFPIEGFNHPFQMNENFGTWLDLQYGGADLVGGWVSFNAIPTAAHTIWGVLVGKLLLDKKTAAQKLKHLFAIGIALVIIGYAMDSFIPIIKRIATASFVVVSGGWSILVMAFLYWLLDVKKAKGNWTTFFTIISMNSLFIYLFAHLNGSKFIEQIIRPITNTGLSWVGDFTSNVVTYLLVWGLLWGLCYWMYKKRLFIKI